jgi:hypothetical protein
LTGSSISLRNDVHHFVWPRESRSRLRGHAVRDDSPGLRLSRDELKMIGAGFLPKVLESERTNVEFASKMRLNQPPSGQEPQGIVFLSQTSQRKLD